MQTSNLIMELYTISSFAIFLSNAEKGSIDLMNINQTCMQIEQRIEQRDNKTEKEKPDRHRSKYKIKREKKIWTGTCQCQALPVAPSLAKEAPVEVAFPL